MVDPGRCTAATLELERHCTVEDLRSAVVLRATNYVPGWSCVFLEEREDVKDTQAWRW